MRRGGQFFSCASDSLAGTVPGPRAASTWFGSKGSGR